MINIDHRSLRLLHNDIKQQTVNDSVNQNDKSLEVVHTSALYIFDLYTICFGACSF